MAQYALYLESGPRRRKTMVHVLDLLGCIAQGPTTEAAQQAAPTAIGAYLHFLDRHGEAAKPEGKFTTAIAAHVTEGVWLGYGDPTPGFAPDFGPLSAEDLGLYLRRLGWLRAELLELLRDVPLKQLTAEPRGPGRTIGHILKHSAETHGTYLRYLVGKVDGLAPALRAVSEGPLEALPAALTHLWQVSDARLAILTAAERKQLVPHGQVTWTARRALRRMLEHEWEHLNEIAERLGNR